MYVARFDVEQVYQGKRELIPSHEDHADDRKASISGKTRIDPQPLSDDVAEAAKYIRENEN